MNSYQVFNTLNRFIHRELLFRLKILSGLFNGSLFRSILPCILLPLIYSLISSLRTCSLRSSYPHRTYCVEFHGLVIECVPACLVNDITGRKDVPYLTKHFLDCLYNLVSKCRIFGSNFCDEILVCPIEVSGAISDYLLKCLLRSKVLILLCLVQSLSAPDRSLITSCILLIPRIHDVP